MHEKSKKRQTNWHSGIDGGQIVGLLRTNGRCHCWLHAQHIFLRRLGVESSALKESKLYVCLCV